MKQSKILSVLLGILLLGSLATNYALLVMLKRDYFNLNATRLDPLGLVYYEGNLVESGKSEQSRRVVMFGDSRIDLWTPPRVETIDGLEHIKFINRGVSGQTTAQIDGRFADHVAPLQPDIVLLQLGINDLKTIALFPELAEEIVANCKANIESIVHKSQALGASVILTTIFSPGPIPTVRRFVWSSDVDEAIRDVNAFIFTLVGDTVTIMDADTILSGDDHVMDEKYRVDMLHVNEDAYEVLNAELIQILSDSYE